MSKVNSCITSSAICEPVRYLRKPSSLFGYVYVEVNQERSNIGFRADQPLAEFSYCIDKAGRGDASKFRLEA